ncbi:MAG TPA: hypothetical protein V6C84_26400 [Coleofasciculaceae cyanobacterium]|jgi:hypothetical protein
MIPKKENLILAEKLVIFNNVAAIGKCKGGRLLAELQIYPSPRISWNFETLGRRPRGFPSIGSNLSGQKFTGYNFNLGSLAITQTYQSTSGVLSATGNATEAIWGNPDTPAHTFHFCLPNTRFQFKCLNQDRLELSIYEQRVDSTEESLFQEQREEGRFVEVTLDSTWVVKLEVRKEALKWLDPQKRNIGTMLTCWGELYQSKRAEVTDDLFTSLVTIKLLQAEERLKSLSQLLSYANGGFISPIFIDSELYSKQNEHLGIKTLSSKVTTNYQITPIELLGSSWFIESSNLKGYIACLTTLEKMFSSGTWKETFYFALVQYFQAIRYGDWQIAASATGAALERLSYEILVEDETNSTLKTQCELLFDISQQNQARQVWNLGRNPGQENISITGKRLRLLLERIGLSTARGLSDVQDVQAFLNVRNDAVHPRVSSITLNDRWRSITRAMQWIDEVLLWRLGYNGKYLGRIALASMAFPITGSPATNSSPLITDPRYDLSLRDSNW